MIRYLKAALCAATMLGSTHAQAATYLTYKFETSGIGSFTNTRSFPATVTPLQNMIFSFSFNTDSVQDTPQGQSIFTGGGALSVSGNGLSIFSQSLPNVFDNVFRITLSASTFENLGGVFGTGFYGVRSGSVSYTAGSGSGNTEYSGSVVAISATASSTPSDFTGLRIVNGVPEPTTWALMLAGFAMTGYALRRRRAKVAFA